MRNVLISALLVSSLAAQEPASTPTPAPPGEVYRPGRDVSPPELSEKTEPEYSELARLAKVSGTVTLSIIVDKNGMPRNIRVISPLGFGLDEKAVEAVQQWRFRPGVKDANPVAVRAMVQVSFRLLATGWRLQKLSFTTPPDAQPPVFQAAEYPKIKHPLDADLTVKGEINEHGTPANLSVENPTGEDYEAELLAALANWQFAPAIKDSKPISIPVTFDFVQIKSLKQPPPR